MNCIICKTDISIPVKQYGSARQPICQSCYLKGLDWVSEDSELVDLLKHGESLDEAMKTLNQKHNNALEKEFLGLMLELSLGIPEL